MLLGLLLHVPHVWSPGVCRVGEYPVGPSTKAMRGLTRTEARPPLVDEAQLLKLFRIPCDKARRVACCFAFRQASHTSYAPMVRQHPRYGLSCLCSVWNTVPSWSRLRLRLLWFLMSVRSVVHCAITGFALWCIMNLNVVFTTLSKI